MSNCCAQEHCLMGMRGSMKRDADSEQVHANIDLDVILEDEPNDSVAAGDRAGATAIDKPEEVFHVIEHFCQLRRRLHLFGRDSTLRPGWVTVGPECGLSTRTYLATNPLDYDPECRRLADEIERARPKSPSRLPPPSQLHFCRGGRRICICLQLRPETGGLCCVRWLSAFSEESSARTRQSESLEGPADPPLARRLVCWRRAAPVSGAHADALSSSRRHLSNAAPAATARAAGASVPRVGRHHYLLPPTALGALCAAGPPLVHAGGAMHQFRTVGPAARLVGRRVAQASAPLSARRAAPAAAHTGRSRCAAAAADGRRGTTTTHADYWLSTGVPSPARQTER